MSKLNLFDIRKKLEEMKMIIFTPQNMIMISQAKKRADPQAGP